MSKTTLKKLLGEMTREQMAEMILQLYEARRDAREYLDYFASPDEKKLLDHYKAVARREFAPERGKPKGRSMPVRAALRDAASLYPSADALADLYLSVMETVAGYAVRNRDEVRPPHERLLVDLMRLLVAHLDASHLRLEYAQRLEKIMLTFPDIYQWTCQSLRDLWEGREPAPYRGLPVKPSMRTTWGHRFRRH